MTPEPGVSEVSGKITAQERRVKVGGMVSTKKGRRGMCRFVGILPTSQLSEEFCRDRMD